MAVLSERSSSVQLRLKIPRKQERTSRRRGAAVWSIFLFFLPEDNRLNGKNPCIIDFFDAAEGEIDIGDYMLASSSSRVRKVFRLDASI
jgi:hypothetical protein